MANSGWKAERDGAFTVPVASRRLKPPPATPWARLELEWRMSVTQECPWRGDLEEVLEAATWGMREANRAPRKAGKGSRWESVEAFLHGYAKSRCWILTMDRNQDLLMIRPDPGRQSTVRQRPTTGTHQPSLFDKDQA